MTSFEMTIPDHVRENYADARIAQGLTWEQMAEQFDRDADPLPPEHAAPYRELAAWARAQHDDVDAADGTEDVGVVRTADGTEHVGEVPASAAVEADAQQAGDAAPAAAELQGEHGADTKGSAEQPTAPEPPATSTKRRKPATTQTSPTRSA